jgi:Mrp family chromosome partitioning ATPase
MADIIDTLVDWFDIVLVDAPPLLPVTDAAILSKRTGGAIVMAAAGKTYRPQLKGALGVLDAVGADVLGIVLTMLPVAGRGILGYGDSAYGYGYGYGYEYEPRAQKSKKIKSEIVTKDVAVDVASKDAKS